MLSLRAGKKYFDHAGRRTRLDLTLGDLLGRLASAFTIILGLFVAAVVIFPTFNPGDLIAGLGITSVAIGLHLRMYYRIFLPAFSFSGGGLYRG